jgi:hypothetical protein
LASLGSVEVEFVILVQQRVTVGERATPLFVTARILHLFVFSHCFQGEFSELFVEGVFQDALSHFLVVIFHVFGVEFSSLMVKRGAGVGVGE